MKNLIPVETILERDIDLLLLEEFNSSNSFAHWILETIEIDGLADIQWVYAKHSITESGLWESDIVVILELVNWSKHCLLIENKISAEFANKQDLRYYERWKILVEREVCNDFTTVLVSPSWYGNALDFDYYISYEKILEYFQAKWDKRSEYKANILDCAIERRRRWYTGIKNKHTTNFWEEYWKYLEENAPELNMNKPEDKRKESYFILFRCLASYNCMFRQKLRVKHSCIDIEFKSGTVDSLNDKYADVLLYDMQIVPIWRYGLPAIRVKLPSLLTEEPFSDQKENVKFVVDKIKYIHQWAKDNL